MANFLHRCYRWPAGLVAAGVLFAGCNPKRPAPGEPSPVETRTPGGSSSPSTAAAVGSDFAPAGPPKSLGEGVVVGLSRDGSAAYVIAEQPRSGQVGCEGMPAQFLFAVPLDGSPRKLAAESFQPINGALQRSPDGSLLSIAEYCEEFFVRLLIASEKPGGSLDRIRELQPSKTYEVFNAVTWSSDSKSLISSAVMQLGPQPERDLVRIDVTSGAVSVQQKATEAIAAAELAGGTLVMVSAGKQVKVGDREVDFEGFNISVSPDRSKAAVFGTGGVLVVDSSGEPRVVNKELSFTGNWTPDSKAVFYNNKQGELLLTVPGGKTTRLADGAQYGPGMMTPDGRRLVYTYEPTPGDTPSPPTVRVLESR